jgi:predicted hydrocarbon binding protein
MSTRTAVIETGIAGTLGFGKMGQTSQLTEYPSVFGEGSGDSYERIVTIAGGQAFVSWHATNDEGGRQEKETLQEETNAFDVDRLSEELRETYTRFGWGRIEVRTPDIHKNELTVVMRDSPGVKCLSEKGPACWHVRASIEVIVSNVLGVQAEAFEVACEATNRRFCEFKVRWTLPNIVSQEPRGPRGLARLFHNGKYAY